MKPVAAYNRDGTRREREREERSGMSVGPVSANNFFRLGGGMLSKNKMRDKSTPSF